MITFSIGILILLFGYIFYSRYVEQQFVPNENKTPALKINDGVDFVPLSTWRNLLIHLLNIAGLGPILGAIQGILFGPIAFILIPLGCVLMGGVHDYFAGMISVRNDGAQITDLIKKYLGNKFYQVFLIILSVLLLLLAGVFVYTSGDIMAQKFFGQTDFSLSNPIIMIIYFFIALYYILASLFPIDKIIGKFYPLFATTLILGTLFVIIGFFIHHGQLQELDFRHLNFHPKNLPLLPMFFMTVSCGLLSGFHSTQATIVSRTIKTEKEGKQLYYGMMCTESLIAMIWAAAAMHVYSLNIIPEKLVGTANVINSITDVFVSPVLAIIVTLAVVILPITSGDTALRALRMTIADAISLKQNALIDRLKVIVPIAVLLLGILYWAKSYPDSFSLIWQYFNFGNQLIAVPTFLFATIFLYKQKKNYLITLLSALFYIFVLTAFICSNKIGLNLSYKIADIIGIIATLISLLFVIRHFKSLKINA